MNIKVLTFLILVLTSAAFSDDFKTIDGREYKDAAVSRVEPDGIVIKSKSGISKLYFVELPNDVQARFHYNPQQAAAYSTEQAANSAAYQNQQQKEQQKQQEENRRQQDAVAAQSAQLQATWNRSRDLQDRYLVLQREEDALLLRIGEAEKPGPGYWVGRKLHHYPNPLREQLPLLKTHLSDVRHEKNQVREQLDRAQR